MKSKKLLISCCAAAVLLAAVILLIGGFVYILAPDGESDIISAEKSEDIDIDEIKKERLLSQKADSRKLNTDVKEHRENELVFSFSIDDYIESYNGHYWQEHEKRYILPAGFDNWQMQTLETGIHSPYKTIFYDYSADRKMLSLPLISFYVPPENDSVQEIAVIFDWHSYSRELHDLYEEICCYSVKTILPELTDEQIVKLCSQINGSGYDHAFSMDEWYGSGSVPYELFYKGGIGIYSHFAVGSRQRLCIIPVTEQTLDEFARKGTVIHEIEATVPAVSADSAESGLEKRLPATDEEKKATEEKMLKAAGICAAQYIKSAKISTDTSGQAAISQSDRDAMEESLANAGYCVTDSNAVYPEYAKNPEKLELFWKNVLQGKEGQAEVWSILQDGSLSCRIFRYANGKGSCLHAAAEWNDAGEASITYLEKKEILFWDMTSSGFIYQDNYLNRHYNAAVLLRLKPVDRRLYEYTEKYIAPVGYHNVNLFLLDWNSGDFGHVCFNDLFSGLYLKKYGNPPFANDFPFSDTPFYHSEIPSELFETVVLEHFNICIDGCDILIIKKVHRFFNQCTHFSV